MNTIKRQQSEFPVFGDVMANLFDDPFFAQRKKVVSTPKVNIIENNESYTIELASPGMNKDQFEIDLKENLLIITGKAEKKELEENKKFTLKEFSYDAFKRSFKLPKNTDAANIKATYFDGILAVNVPKLAEKEKEIKKIEIS